MKVASRWLTFGVACHVRRRMIVSASVLLANVPKDSMKSFTVTSSSRNRLNVACVIGTRVDGVGAYGCMVTDGGVGSNRTRVSAILASKGGDTSGTEVELPNMVCPVVSRGASDIVSVEFDGASLPAGCATAPFAVGAALSALSSSFRLVVLMVSRGIALLRPCIYSRLSDRSVPHVFPRCRELTSFHRIDQNLHDGETAVGGADAHSDEISWTNRFKHCRHR